MFGNPNLRCEHVRQQVSGIEGTFRQRIGLKHVKGQWNQMSEANLLTDQHPEIFHTQ